MRALGASRISVAPGGTLIAGWARNELWRRARAVPSLDLRFADNKSLVDATTGQNLVTFTRASSGTYVDSTGMIKTATTNEARFDHNPTTGESLGLLVEEQRTNLLLRSEELDNARWIYGGGSIAANNATAPNGQTVAETWTTGAGQTATLYQQITCLASTTYTFSFYIRLGTLPLADYRFALRDDTNAAFIAQDIVPNATPVTTEWRRVSYTFTTPVGCVLVRPYLIRSSSVSGGSVGFWGAQLEAGAFPTSYIPTTTATVTRSADVASISGSNFSSWYRQDEGTVFAEGSSFSTASGSRVLAAIDDLSMSNRFQITLGGGYTPNFAAVSAGAVSADLYGAALTQGANTRLCSTYRVNDFALSSNGGNPVTDTSGALPVFVSTARLGVFQNNTGYLNGTIRRLTYWPVRLGNTVLQQITQ